MTRETLWNEDGFTPLAMYDSAAGAQYVVTDHLGTPRLVTDAGGDVTWSAHLTPWGAVMTDGVQTYAQPLRFPGQVEVAGGGVVYNWWRWYEAGFGRYLEVDPMFSSGSPFERNFPYLYLVGDPFGTDPTGDYNNTCKEAVERLQQTILELKKKITTHFGKSCVEPPGSTDHETPIFNQFKNVEKWRLEAKKKCPHLADVLEEMKIEIDILKENVTEVFAYSEAVGAGLALEEMMEPVLAELYKLVAKIVTLS